MLNKERIIAELEKYKEEHLKKSEESLWQSESVTDLDKLIKAINVGDFDERVSFRGKSHEMGEAFMEWTNSMVLDSADFEKAVTNSHRTLQQTAFKVMYNCIKIWAGFADKGYYDDRNKQTVLLSKTMVKSVEGEDYIPFI